MDGKQTENIQLVSNCFIVSKEHLFSRKEHTFVNKITLYNSEFLINMSTIIIKYFKSNQNSPLLNRSIWEGSKRNDFLKPVAIQT